MEITITLRDVEDGQVEIEEILLPSSGETSESITTASVLYKELRKKLEELGEVETNACGIPVTDDSADEWQEL